MNKEQQIVEFQNDIIDNLFDGGTYKLAEALYNAGYRKLSGDSVVLSREEHEILVKTAQGKIGNMKATDFLKACISSGFMVEAVSTKEQVKQAVKEFAERLKIETTVGNRLCVKEYDIGYNDGYSEAYYNFHKTIDELLKEYEQ